MRLEINIVFCVYALVGPDMALAFCACTTVPTPDTDLEVVCGIYQAAGKNKRQ